MKSIRYHFWSGGIYTHGTLGYFKEPQVREHKVNDGGKGGHEGNGGMAWILGAAGSWRRTTGVKQGQKGALAWKFWEKLH